jgi:hypothetical protein
VYAGRHATINKRRVSTEKRGGARSGSSRPGGLVSSDPGPQPKRFSLTTEPAEAAEKGPLITDLGLQSRGPVIV